MQLNLQARRTLSWKQPCIHRAIPRRLGVARSFFNHFLQHVPIQCQIGHQALKPRVLVPQLPQLTHFQDPQVRVALLPDIVRRLADPHLAAHIRDRLAGVTLLEGNRICSSLNFDFFIASSPCLARTPETPYSSSIPLRQIGVTSLRPRPHKQAVRDLSSRAFSFSGFKHCKANENFANASTNFGIPDKLPSKK